MCVCIYIYIYIYIYKSTTAAHTMHRSTHVHRVLPEIALVRGGPVSRALRIVCFGP